MKILLCHAGISAEQDVAMELETTTQPHPAGVIAPLCLPEESGDAEMTTPPKPASSPDVKCLQDIPDTDADDASLLLDRKSSIVIIYIILIHLIILHNFEFLEYSPI